MNPLKATLIALVALFATVSHSLTASAVELKADDGTSETTISYPSLIGVNRLTPNHYPATLKTIRIFFRQVNPTPVGSEIRLIAFSRNAGSIGQISNPTLLIDQKVTIPSVSLTGQFVDYTIQNGPTISSGDFFVGFQQPSSQSSGSVPFFWADLNGPQQQRAYVSVDNGATYLGDVRQNAAGNPLLNFLIRAEVEEAPALSVVSSASLTGNEVAPESIATVFGSNLSDGLASSANLPLPTTLGGVQVKVRDSQGNVKSAPLFYVSPSQINFQVPEGTALGTATIEIVRNGSTQGTGTVQVAAVAPGLFTANASGQGVAKADIFRIKANGSQQYESVSRLASDQKSFVTAPIDLGPETDQVYLVLYGTGIRGRSALGGVSTRIGGTLSTVSYAGVQETYIGLDQINVRIARSLIGRGEVDVQLTADGKTANTVRINIAGTTNLTPSRASRTIATKSSKASKKKVVKKKAVKKAKRCARSNSRSCR